MASETPLPDSELPVKVDVPDVSAPPTLAEPASGPVAEMSGALGATSAEDKPTVEAPESGVNGATESEPAPATGDATAPTETASEPPKTSTEETLAAADTKVEEVAEEKKDEPASEVKADEAPAETNGDPDSKQSSKRKSGAGIPEHKGKKLNKKKSMPKITHLDAKPGDHFFARLRSYPPWPSIICDQDMLPSSLINTRPVTAMKLDGTYNEAYADGGKKVNERTYPIMFLYTNEFAWIPNTDLGDLDPEYCKNVPEKGKSKSLLSAYEIAAEHHDLEFFKNMLTDHANAMAEDEALQAEAAAAKAEAKANKNKEKKKRKSEAKVKATDDDDEDVEMEDVDDTAETKKSSKKRKKAAESDDDEPEKPTKTPKTQKLKFTTGKTPTTDKKTKEKSEKPAKSKGEKRKSKAAPVDDDEEMHDAPEKEPPKPVDPVAEKKAREKEVLFLRHKLQKGFLSRDQAPQEEDMPQMAQYIKKLEDYEDLEVSIIRTTKINKVLKALVKLNSIPRDEEYSFKKRSVDLLAKWNKALGADPADGDAAAEEKETAKSTPATNGVHDGSADEKQEENKDEPAAPSAPEITATEPPKDESEAKTEAPAVTEEPKSEAPAASADVAQDATPAEGNDTAAAAATTAPSE